MTPAHEALLMMDDSLRDLVARIGHPVHVVYAAGRWTATATPVYVCAAPDPGPGSASGPTLALALARLADRADARNARLAAEMDECDAANEREDAARAAR